MAIYTAAPSSFKDMPDAVLHFAGVPPIRALDMPTTVQDGDSEVSKARLAQYARMLEARGILVNSFDRLESRALSALRCGLCAPGCSTPPVHCIRPLVLPGNTGGISKRHACLQWLDAQPDRSVVFLSFGSLGRFSTAQLREMARGLENSGQRFLWVVRNPPEHQSNSVEPDLASLLPEGFLDRTREKGFVVKNWAPQSVVLRHQSVGAFVTHCGWNSAVEALAAGMPMVVVPQWADQPMNAMCVEDVWRVGVRARPAPGVAVVRSGEVERCVREVMEGETGAGFRRRALDWSRKAKKAVSEGGSSDTNILEFISRFRSLQVK